MSLSNYASFLQDKVIKAPSTGRMVSELSPVLYDFQADICRWALRRGRAAVFADCGLGKSLIQLEWARHVGGTVLIVAPLSVAEQTIQEARKLSLEVRKVRSATEIQQGINITNYEMIRHFIGAPLDGIVCDESSILKSIDVKTRKMLLERFMDVPWKLCCTATPSPNDIAELANHAEFLGVMKRVEMLASFFVHDQDGWRLRGHAKRPFYRWLASWSMALKSPADLGYDGSMFQLPELRIHDVVVETDWRQPGHLFPGGLKGITDRASVRQQSVQERIHAAAKIANSTDRKAIIWCGLNAESGGVTKLVPGAVEVSGADSTEDKIRKITGFLNGEYRVMVTKISVAGFGMNFQVADLMIFLGLGDSFEAYYQGIRRSWRYGQVNPVDVYIVVTDHEIAIVENVRRKEAEAESLSREIIEAAREYEMEELKGIHAPAETITEGYSRGESWEIYQGDCVEMMGRLQTESIDLSVYSPPFQALYTYSASERDMGNSRTEEEFFDHFGFAVTELLRVTKPGRLTCCHVAQVPTTIINHGVIGLIDFRGRVCQEFVKRGWIYHGEVCIDKCPQAQAIRTHAKGLLFVQLRKDASWLRPALADYILVFRKPGENAVPIKPNISNDDWITWARPIWYGIKETDTLNTVEARSNEDDRHICPLQLGTIERCIRLWSNPRETVLSPFAGIGSEGYVALKHGRRFIGIELKPLYARTAVLNLNRAALEQATLFT